MSFYLNIVCKNIVCDEPNWVLFHLTDIFVTGLFLLTFLTNFSYLLLLLTFLTYFSYLLFLLTFLT